MKYLFLICAMVSFTILQAQDLREHIPYNATFVGSINISHILESTAVSELDSSKFGKKILKSVSEKLGHEVSSMDGFGIDIKSTTYFYYGSNDSLYYTVLLAPLKQARFLEDILTNDSVEFTDQGNYKYAHLNNSQFMAWDNKKIVFILGQYNDAYFADYDFSAITAELTVKEENLLEETATGTETAEEPSVEMAYSEMPYIYNYSLHLYASNFHYFCEDLKLAAANNNAAALDDIQSQIETLNGYVQSVDSISQPDPENLDNFIANKVFFLKKAVSEFEDQEVRDRANKMIADATFYSDNFKIVESQYNYNALDYATHSEEKMALAVKWTEHMLHTVMAPAQKSILKNNQYTAQFDTKAAVNVWNSHFGKAIADMYTGVYAAIQGYPKNVSDMVSGYGELSSNLYLDGREAKLTVDMTLGDEFARAYERMGDQKINSRFLKYINEDKLLGYMSYNVNTKNTLEEYPKLIAKTYAPLMEGKMQDELEIGMDFLSLLLDEEAVSKLIKGDALITFTGINEKEVTYTDYEYDEDYNYNPVEKTKKEMLPDFLLMASSEEIEITSKIIDYFVKKQLAEAENGYYKIVDKKNEVPLDLYFAIKNDIFFLSTSAEDMTAIVNDRFVAKLSSKHKKMIKKGNFSAFFNGKQFGQTFPLDNSMPNIEMAKYSLANAADFYVKSSKIKNKKMHSELIMEVPAGHNDTMSYIMDFINHLSK